MCKLPVVYRFEELVIILCKSITDHKEFEIQRRKCTKKYDASTANPKFSLYWNMSQRDSLYSRAKIERLNKHFFHFSTIRDRTSYAASAPTYRRNVSIVLSVQAILPKPFLFPTSFPDESTVYNHELRIDLLWLFNVPVLHVVDTHIYFQNAIYILDKTPEGFFPSIRRVRFDGLSWYSESMICWR